MTEPRVTLDQWLVFRTVIEAGGFARAAARLHRSQSAVSYAVARLQEQLGVALLERRGRRAVLTEAGAALLPRARRLLDDAGALERAAAELAGGWEAEIALVVDRACPCTPVMAALRRFADAGHGTRLRLHEAVMSGVDEALLAGRADIAIGNRVPEGFLGDPLLAVEFVAVAAADHPLAGRNRPIGIAELRRETQVVVVDSGAAAPRDDGLVGADLSWYVASLESKRAAILAGLGFGWLPRHMIADDLSAGRLRVLPMEAGGTRRGSFYLVRPAASSIGPAATLLADLLREAIGEWSVGEAAPAERVECPNGRSPTR